MSWAGRRAAAWLAVPVAQLVGAAVFFLLPEGPAPQGPALPAALARPLLVVALNALTAAVLVIGTRRLRPATTGGWYLLAAGQVLNTAGWAYWYLYPVAASVTLPTPSVADGLFLSSYAVSALGLALLAHRHGADRRALFDAAILATVVAVIMWVLLADRATAPEFGAWQQLLNFAYPVMDLALLAAAVSLALTVHRSPRSVLLLLWGALQLVANTVFNLGVLTGSGPLDSPPFTWFLASFAALSAAALHPANSRLRLAVPRRLRSVLVVAGVLPLPILLVARAFESSASGVGVVAGGSIVVTALLLLRVSAASGAAPMTAATRALIRRSTARLCAGFLLLALMPLAGLTYLAVDQARNTVDAEVDRRLTTGVDVSVTYVVEQMNSLKALAASYAERPSVVELMAAENGPDQAKLQEHLVSLQSRNPSFIGVWAMDARGTMLAFDPPAPFIGQNFARRDYFQGVMRTGQPYVSEAYLAALPGKPRTVAVTAPVMSGGRIIGSIGIGLRLETISAFTARVADVQKIHLRLTDRNGALLAGPGSEKQGLPSGLGDRHLAAALGGRSGITRDAVNGVDSVTAYRSIPRLGWAVVADVPTSEAYAGADRFAGRIYAVASLLAPVLLLGLVLAVRAERRRRIAEAAVVKREEQVSSILEAAGDGFISIDARGFVTHWNSQAEKVFGWSAGEALGRAVTDLVVPGVDSADRAERFQRVLAGGRSTLPDQRIEVEVRRRDGTAFPAEITLWSSASGDDVAFSAFVRDMTERKRYESELAAARDEALAASRMKSEFVANMSHEIRTPMNGVIGLTTLLLETELDARQRDYLNTVQNSADALLNVINDILDFSKIEAGKLDIDPVDFDVRALAEDVVSLLAATAQAKGLEIAAVVHPALPPTVCGDAHRIRQILTNLVANAVKFTERGEVIVEVAVGEAVGEDRIREVTFAVVDTGIGIPADRQEHLFEAFTQVDASTTRRYGGTGLGLTISRQLIELMGGTIGLVSEVGAGSRFTFTLPLPSATTSPASPPVPADLAGVRVLVVDDNPTNRKVVQDLLAMWQMRPSEVADGEAALAVLRRAAGEGDPYAVALLDMHMPGLDGIEVARAVLADDDLSATHLAMLTSTNQPGEAQKARECGIEAYLTKPVRSAQLRAALMRLLGGASRAGATPAGTRSRIPAGTPVARILVAEDNEVNQQVVVEMLASLGYAADVAADGEQTLRMLGERRYDAVLMDCQMPGLDGFQATERLRRMPAPVSETPVIALTASALAADEQRCLDAGMDDFLAKPLRKNRLDEVLRMNLSAAQGRDGGTEGGGSNSGGSDGPADPEVLLDPEALEELREMGPAFVDRVLTSYLRNAPDTAAAIRVAAAREDVQELARLAHRLRGSSGTLAGRQLAATCGDLERAALTSDLATATALAASVQEQTERTCQALRAALGVT